MRFQMIAETGSKLFFQYVQSLNNFNIAMRQEITRSVIRYYSISPRELEYLRGENREEFIKEKINDRFEIFFKNETYYFRFLKYREIFEVLEQVARAISYDVSQDLTYYKIIFNKIISLLTHGEKLYIERFFSRIFFINLPKDFFIFVHDKFQMKNSFPNFFLLNYCSYNVNPNVLLDVLKNHRNEINRESYVICLWKIVLVHHNALLYQPYEKETKEIISILRKTVDQSNIDALIEKYSLYTIDNWYIYNLLKE